MSFSTQVKEELSKLKNLSNKELVKYELLGYLISNNVGFEKNKIRFMTESEHNINRFAKLNNNLGYTNYKIEIQGKKYCITILKKELEELFKLDKIKDETIENKKAFIRGAFLGAGSINNPQNTYHLEMSFYDINYLEIASEILKQFEIEFKTIQKNKAHTLYSKDGDEISKFLALIGANNSMLKFEQIRVYREVKNNVNRKVNCETANLNKIIDASVKQIDDIKFLKQIGVFEKLPKQLIELANLRIENPEASLVELGQLLQIPIGKSGVSHRFGQISKIVKKIKSEKN